jgi:hypothetical protein
MANAFFLCDLPFDAGYRRWLLEGAKWVESFAEASDTGKMERLSTARDILARKDFGGVRFVKTRPFFVYQ